MIFDLESTLKDPSLNGSNGLFRVADRLNNQAGADTDYGALQSFLRSRNSPQTIRGYKKECERLLIWSTHYIRKPISSLTKDDFEDFIEFMSDPAPEWCGKKTNKSKDTWRPFTGKMNETAIKTAVASINSFLNWLVKAQYITGNPLALLGNKNKAELSEGFVQKKVVRVLDEDMWPTLLHVVEEFPDKTPAELYQKERIRFMLTLFAALGGRISEVANIKMCDFKNYTGGWFWEVKGKGAKDGTVAMPKDMVNALMRWRKYLGLSPLPTINENIPAIPSVNKSYVPIINKPGIKPRRINQILKEFFSMAAEDLYRQGHEDKAEKIKLASAHWLRHTSVTQKINAGIDRRLVQLDARHSDARTTDLYSHEEDKLRYKEAQKHKLGWSE